MRLTLSSLVSVGIPMQLGSAPARPVLQTKTRRCIAETDVESPGRRWGPGFPSRPRAFFSIPRPRPDLALLLGCRRPCLSNFTRRPASGLFLGFRTEVHRWSIEGVPTVGVFHPWPLDFCRSRASQPARGPRSVLTGRFSMPSLAASPVQWASMREEQVVPRVVRGPPQPDPGLPVPI